MGSILWRQRYTIHHMEAIAFSPSSSSSSSHSSYPFKSIRNFFTHTNPTNFQVAPSKFLTRPRRFEHKNCVFLNLIVRTKFDSATSLPRVGDFALRRKPNFPVGKSISRVSSSASSSTVGWSDVSFPEIGDVEGSEGGGVSSYETEDERVTGVSHSVPVRAFFLTTSVDLRSLMDNNRDSVVPSSSRMTNYVVLRFGAPNSDTSALGVSSRDNNYRYMVVFQYGSVVLFNVPEQEFDGYLATVKKHGSGFLSETRKDEYEIRVNENLSTWMRGGLDYILLQDLEIDGIRTIGSVLGQSIALDYYVRQVDGMVAEFTDINRGMEKTGTFKMQRKKLFQLVGKANSNLADVILKLGLFERSDIAWKNAKYAQIWEYLRDEFELTQRFASLDFKLKFVEHNIRFLQEILQNRKTDFLEWLIIVLISIEILLSVYDIGHRAGYL
ncbi:OLC1v1025929C1 [Oldenlandia corymbosa var. corymbosa]|uniref:OLC1v1025929C1 n=1 Tax=Oldenlandia corymbosa var. corymbosa TaxID=529605 RepID=A0AAV1C7N1_OLDCO|nr:OLC1v1025929C1 [Oldenlandia corymbosa var. corymbosa]